VLVWNMTFASELHYANPVFTLLSAFVNIIFAALIVSRLVYHRRYVRNVLGAEHGSPYTSTITICVESSALTVISSGLFTILYFVSPMGKFFVYDIIPHIYVSGLELHDFWCMSEIFYTTRLSPHYSSSIALL
jgi:hypothetical protein